MKNLRPAATAIAAVLALSSTPLLAQVAEEPVTAPAPETPAPSASDPLAPEPVAETPTAAEPAAAAPTRTTRARTTTRTPRAQPAPRATEPRAPTAAPPAVTAAPPIEPVIEQPSPAEPAVPAAPLPVAAPAEQPAAVDTFLASDEALPIAGAAGLGILALAGAGLVARRRRRRRDAEYAQWQEYAEATPAAIAEPGHIPAPQRATMEPTFVRAFADAPAAAPIAAPVVAAAATAHATTPAGPATALPKDFDLSRFGPHVQAAYKGPTPDNPSLSLKYRLRRAAALDQMARKAGIAPAASRPAQPTAPRPAAHQPNGEFLLRRAPARPNIKPAYSE